MKRVCRLFLITSILVFPCTANAVTTYFNEVDIGGGIMASAEAEITSGLGWLDIVLKNTSGLGGTISPNGIANPFITEIEFVYNSLTLDESASYARSFSDSWFAQGAGNPAEQKGERDLYYRFVEKDTTGMDRCWMSGGSEAEADNVRNDNTIASLAVLDGTYTPQEGWANGFLNTSPDVYSGAIFDKIRFHFVYEESDTTPDASYYATADTWVVKFIGGGESEHVANVPEPATVVMLGLGVLAVLIRRKNKKNFRTKVLSKQRFRLHS